MIDNIQDNMKNIEEEIYILLKKIIILVLYLKQKRILILIKKNIAIIILFTASSGNFCIRSHSNEGPSSWRNRRKR